MPEFQVELRNVNKQYGTVTVTRKVSLGIRKGEFFSLLGPSGCGKSTLLRMIAGFVDPTDGDVFVRGRDMAGIPPERRNVGIVFQNYALFPHMSVFENIAFGLRVRNVAEEEIRQRVERMLRIVDLDGFGARRSNELSGGQQQRVALARALVIEPDLLLLDEPLGALDRKLRESMQLRLVEVQRQLGVTTLFVTHDQEEALTMSDRIAVMSTETHGIEQIGTPREIYNRPASVHVSRFIGRTNLWEEQIVATVGKDRVRTARGFELQRIVDLAIGETTSVCVRPERIFLRRQRPDEANAVAGKVRDKIFVGEATIYHVDTELGITMEMREQNGETGDGTADRGDEVFLSWSPAAMLAVR